MKRKIIVIKVGTGVLKGNGHLNEAAFSSILSQAGELMSQGLGVIIVSSGAIQSAKYALQSKKHLIVSLDLPSLASIGQPILMRAWIQAGESLSPELFVAQILPTDASIDSRHEWDNSAQVIDNCLNEGIVPIINYNDPISFAAIDLLTRQANDNDKLTADFAPHVGASAVMFITEAGGVHSDDPSNGATKIYREIDWNNPPDCSRSKMKYGRGGMAAKIRYAIECRKAGIKRVCITGLTSNVITRFAKGEWVSTMVGSKNVF